MKTIIRLHGILAQEYGEEFELYNINKPMDIISALEIRCPGIRKKIIEFYLESSVYELIINEETVHSSKFNENYEEAIRTVDFCPSIFGAKSFVRGFVAIVVGVILIAASFGLGPLGNFGFMQGAFAQTLAFGAGVGLVVAGVQYLTTSIPETEPGQRIGDQALSTTSMRNASFAFSSPTNTTQQGVPVPIGYGRLRVGSKVIGTKLSNYQLHVDRQPGYSSSPQLESLLKIQEVFASSTSTFRGY